MDNTSKPMFWRDARMPYVELRKVGDGRKVCYAPHSHTQWSLGAIIEGNCTYLYRNDQFQVGAGTLVMMNPNWVHACNPIDNQLWGYLMLYVDTQWLTDLRYSAGLLDTPCWQDISTAIVSDANWYAGYCRMVECLLDAKRECQEKETAVVDYLTALMCELADKTAQPLTAVPGRLQALATYLKHYDGAELSLETLCERSGYSPGHLIRSFKQYFGFTPHAYLINARIQRGQQQLKSGTSIADTALNTGFADQPHFQRTFKRLLAATPKQYRESLLNQKKTTAGGQ